MITRTARHLRGLGLVLAAWLAMLAGVMRFSDAAPAALVLFPSSGFLAALPDGTAIVGRSALSVTLRSDRAGFVRGLYQAGARAVLPAGLTGCLALQV